MRVERRADGGEGCSGSAGGVVVTVVCSSAGGCSGHRTGRAGMRLSRVPRGAKNGWGGGGFCKSERECCKGGLTIWRQDEEEDEENGRASLRLFHRLGRMTARVKKAAQGSIITDEQIQGCGRCGVYGVYDLTRLAGCWLTSTRAKEARSWIRTFRSGGRRL